MGPEGVHKHHTETKSITYYYPECTYELKHIIHIICTDSQQSGQKWLTDIPECFVVYLNGPYSSNFQHMPIYSSTIRPTNGTNNISDPIYPLSIPINEQHYNEM